MKKLIILISLLFTFYNVFSQIVDTNLFTIVNSSYGIIHGLNSKDNVVFILNNNKDIIKIEIEGDTLLAFKSLKKYIDDLNSDKSKDYERFLSLIDRYKEAIDVIDCFNIDFIIKSPVFPLDMRNNLKKKYGILKKNFNKW